MLMATWKVAPALAAGCAAILKPSELASVCVLFPLTVAACFFVLLVHSHAVLCSIFRTCLELGEICKEVGLPPGVLNILTGLGPEAGAPLAVHPDVDKVQFPSLFKTIEVLFYGVVSSFVSCIVACIVNAMYWVCKASVASWP